MSELRSKVFSFCNAVKQIIARWDIDPFVLMLLLASIVTVVAIVSDYANCFQDAEAVVTFTPAVLETGPNFSKGDIVNIFNVWGFDNGWNRPRFLSYLAYIVSIKTRLILWRFMRPHPTVSIVWIFTLFWAPWILFKFLREILEDATAALAGVVVYLSTVGYLFSGTMIFHPGKPLLNIVAIALLYLSARDAPPESTERVNPAFSPSVWKGIIPLLTASLFLDEMALFCFVILPVWSPRYFLPYRLTKRNIKTCIVNSLIYCIPAVILLIMILFVAPWVTNTYFEKNFDFFGEIQKNTNNIPLTLEFISWHVMTFFSASLLPWKSLQLRVPVPEGPTANLWWVKLFYLVLAGAVVYLVRKARGFGKVAARVFIILILFLLLQSFNISFHIQRVVLVGIHYGSLFAVMFAVLAGLMTVVIRRHIRYGRWIALVLLSYIVVMQFTNFLEINNSWRIHSDWKAAVTFPTRDWENPKEFVVALIARKIRKDLGVSLPRYYLDDTSPVDGRAKALATEAIWKDWKQGKCDPFTQKHDLMFLQNLWLYSELCPEEFSVFH